VFQLYFANLEVREDLPAGPMGPYLPAHATNLDARGPYMPVQSFSGRAV